MGESLAVASSAVGIISLGLTVCNAIVDYGRAYRAFGEDIQNVKSKAESIGENLEILRDAIEYTRIAQPETAIVLSNKIIRIESVLLRLESKIKRYGPSVSPESLTRKTFKKTTYPFRKDDFRDLVADLNSVQDDLQVALEISSYKHALQTTRRMEMFMSRLPPSLLKEWCDEQEPLQIDKTSSSNLLTYGCPNRQKQEYTAKPIRLYSSWLGRAIDISFNMTFGTGGFTICRSLKTQVVIDFDRDPSALHPDLSRILRYDTDDKYVKVLNDLTSKGHLDFSWAIVINQNVIPILDMLIHCLIMSLSGATSFQISRPVEFLLDESGGSVSPDFPFSNRIWSIHPLEEKHVPLIIRLANSGFNFDVENLVEWTRHTKHNAQLLLCKHESLIRMPEVIKMICRENAVELRKALQKERVSPSRNFDWFLCLQWAFGWPEGVQIILDFIKNRNDYFQSYFPQLLFPGNGNHASAALLLRAGCFFNHSELHGSAFLEDGGARMNLLVDELVARRKRLRALAENSLPQTSRPGCFNNNILDGPDCLKVLNLLVEHRVPLSHSSREQVERSLVCQEGDTVYHDLYDEQCAEALYQKGFSRTDVLDSKGNSPLDYLARYCPESKLPRIVKWHISKGANLHRQMSWTNESIGHLLALEMAHNCVIQYGDHASHIASAEDRFQEFIKMGDDFFAPMKASDGCSCPCSLGGCTIVSMVIRELISTYLYPSRACSICVRMFFECLQEWDQFYRAEPRVFIRSLTFNALDLNHTCFANTKKGYVCSRPFRPDDDDYINDNTDEESSLNEFEELLAELEREFEKSTLSLKEYLSGPWYRRVKDHLLTRQSGEEKTIAEAKSVGVLDLDFCGLSVPEWIDLFIANKVEEVTDEDSGNEQ